ncbi:Hypothetical Protein FCC1311_061302 [Hondaea fermentalgiana]|uniref:Uncharacterized protein n=1 Tax=Hondaea fermentalgiana TaxID=2315210 RepID=A0A2R5GGA9_9STRA|nr:Hypothetical Protein FCC1311_061302 [Hondaea fermentalgiana]|eukprot:GBG29910.1 Hypothetical Protein FCC1311_061302 [Hondaea fermentalgiana]
MKNQEKDVEEIYRRASAGRQAAVSVPECLFLKQNLAQDRAFPTVCEEMLTRANRTGLLARRNSRVAKAWDISDGHGVRKMGVTEIPKVLDTVSKSGASQSANDIYLNSRSPEQQEKIRRLHVRTASRGAKPRTHDSFYGAPEVQKDVRSEVKKELVRRHFVLALALTQTNADMTWAPQCTDRLRVCQDGEDPFGGIDLEENPARICSDNKLERATVILTGAAWRSSMYNLWIAQIILEEQLQVPVRIENVNGGSTPYWYYDNSELDKLDGRVYSWDALHLASIGSMDCSAGFKAIYGGSPPADLQEAGCTEDCLPCAHAMLEIWPSGQEDNYNEYVLQRKTVEDGGRLGAVGEFGWWASKSVLDQDPLLSSFRGMKDANATAVFRYPLTFGEYCQRTESEWGFIAADSNPFALNASIPSHFCHLFFEYALLAEYQIVYSQRIDQAYHDTRSLVLERCATNKNTTSGLVFYNLCSQYWVTPEDLQDALPVAATQLIRQGYDGRKFLFEGTFSSDGTGLGMLHSTSCPESPLMPVTPGAEPYVRWQNQGADGYSRFQNRDFDIVASHGLQLQPYNVRSELQDPFERANLETSSTEDANATCSGHGTCIVTEELLQKHPNAGECECDQGYVGDDCSGLVDPDLLNVIIGKSFFFWVVFGFQIATLLYISSARRLFRLHANDSVVFQTAHPWFIELIMQSATAGALGPFAWAGPVTVIHCMLRPVFIAVPFAIIQGAIFTKLQRKKLRLAMNTEDLKATMQAIGFCLVSLFALWFVAFTPSTARNRLPVRVWEEYASCEYGSQLAAFEGLLLVGCLVLLISNCRTAVELRLKPTYFNEGRDLMLTSLATFFVATPSYFAAQVVVSPLEGPKFLVICMTSLATIWVVLYFLIHPKIKVHLYSPELNNFKLGLFHPTGDPSLAIGDPVADMPRILGEAAARRSQVAPSAARPSVIIAPGSKMPSGEGATNTASSRRRMSTMVGTAMAAVRTRAQGASMLRRVSQMVPGPIKSGLARASIVVPVNRRHQVHLENIQDLNSLQGFPSPEVEVKRDPHHMHDPLKRALAYRSPEMYMILEKKIQVVLRENAELTKIIEEHRIDPVTGEMDEDFMDALHRIKMEHEERARQIEDELLGEIDQLEAERDEEREDMLRRHQDDVANLEQEKVDAVEVFKAQHKFQQHKLMVLEAEGKRMASTLRNALPSFEIFLATYNFGVYAEGLRVQGLDSTEKLILASADDLLHAGIPIGHVRKLQTVLASMSDAAPSVAMPEGAEPREAISLITEWADDDSRIEGATSSERRRRKRSGKPKLKVKPAWIENFDPASGRKYLIHPLTGESKWDESAGPKSPASKFGALLKGTASPSHRQSKEKVGSVSSSHDPGNEEAKSTSPSHRQSKDEAKSGTLSPQNEAFADAAEETDGKFHLRGASQVTDQERLEEQVDADEQSMHPHQDLKSCEQHKGGEDEALVERKSSKKQSSGDGKGGKRLALDCAPIEQVYSSDESDQELILAATSSDKSGSRIASAKKGLFTRKKN